MALPKQKLREIALQLLYSYDFKCFDKEGLTSLIMKENKISKSNALLCFELLNFVIEKIDFIDAQITKVSSNYSFERISSVEKNILRIALYEILFEKLIPERVSIAEGIRIAKKYGTPQSAKFVNAILDTVNKKGFDFANQASG